MFIFIPKYVWWGAFIFLSLVVVVAVLRFVFWIVGARLQGGGGCGEGWGWASSATRSEKQKVCFGFLLV